MATRNTTPPLRIAVPTNSGRTTYTGIRWFTSLFGCEGAEQETRHQRHVVGQDDFSVGLLGARRARACSKSDFKAGRDRWQSMPGPLSRAIVAPVEGRD